MSFGNPYQPLYQPMGMPAYPAQMQGYSQPDQYRQAFQPMQPTQMSGANMPQAQQDSGMIWVQGEAGAKAFMVAPGNSAVLWDSEANVIYIKSADASGVPYMRVFDYSERSAIPKNVSQANTNTVRYVTWDEFSKFATRFEEMMKPVTGGEETVNAE